MDDRSDHPRQRRLHHEMKLQRPGNGRPAIAGALLFTSELKGCRDDQSVPVHARRPARTFPERCDQEL
ncbi:hypothetical protein CHELA40_30237 [Chelatococcus asaccharovorans]|nr:hypothetical protein CHELA17_40179 [Chelatococcus asaccharovorans]CAH1688479.1 hypothetical protein CHELA40_30237 [Chelatococcus asaccharovorans]